jgi:CelD/BcsL family acetyltransferase involved in cellulose biosynthesis
MARSDVHYQVVTDAAAWLGVRAAWDALWERAQGPFHARFSACERAYACVLAGAGRHLCVVLGWRGGELVLAWPFVLHRRAGLKVLRPLGPGMADYTPLLVDPSLPTPPLAAAFAAATRASRADLVHLTYLPDGSALHALVAGHARARVVERREVAYAALAEHRGGFDAYARALGSFGSKRKPGQLRRRLEQAGAVTVRFTSGPSEPARGRALVDFVLHHKRNWTAGRVQPGAWLYAPGFGAYLAGLLHAGAACGVELLLDGRPIAASIVGLGHGSVTGVISAFDAQHRALSPGLIVVEECVRYAYEHELAFDFGVGNEAYKHYWSAGRVRPSTSFALPLSLRGALAFELSQRARSVRGWLSARRGSQPDRSPGKGPEPVSASPNVSTAS